MPKVHEGWKSAKWPLEFRDLSERGERMPMKSDSVGPGSSKERRRSISKDVWKLTLWTAGCRGQMCPQKGPRFSRFDSEMVAISATAGSSKRGLVG